MPRLVSADNGRLEPTGRVRVDVLELRRTVSGSAGSGDRHGTDLLARGELLPCDTIVYAETRAEFDIEQLADGVIRVTSVNDPDVREDILRNVE